MMVTKQPTVNLLAWLRWLKPRWVGCLFFQLQLESILWWWTLPAWLPTLCSVVQMTAKEQLSWIGTTSVSCILSLISLRNKSSMCSQNHIFHQFMWSQENTLWIGTHYEQNPIYCSLCFAIKDRDEVVQTAMWHSDTNLIALAPTFKRSKESLQFSTAFSNIQV